MVWCARELGYAGFALFVTILAFAFTACWRTRRLAKRGLIPRELEHFAVGCEAALVAFAVGGSFVIFQYTEMLWHVVGLTMALHSITAVELAARKETASARTLQNSDNSRAGCASATGTSQRAHSEARLLWDEHRVRPVSVDAVAPGWRQSAYSPR